MVILQDVVVNVDSTTGMHVPQGTQAWNLLITNFCQGCSYALHLLVLLCEGKISGVATTLPQLPRNSKPLVLAEDSESGDKVQVMGSTLTTLPQRSTASVG